MLIMFFNQLESFAALVDIAMHALLCSSNL